MCAYTCVCGWCAYVFHTVDAATTHYTQRTSTAGPGERPLRCVLFQLHVYAPKNRTAVMSRVCWMSNLFAIYEHIMRDGEIADAHRVCFLAFDKHLFLATVLHHQKHEMRNMLERKSASERYVNKVREVVRGDGRGAFSSARSSANICMGGPASCFSVIFPWIHDSLLWWGRWPNSPWLTTKKVGGPLASDY